MTKKENLYLFVKKTLVLCIVFCPAFPIPKENMHGPDAFGLESTTFLEATAPTYISPQKTNEVSIISNTAIDFYKKVISPTKGFHCPMHPSCSTYGKIAFQRYWPLKAFWLTSDRLNRCGHDVRFYEVVWLKGESRFYDEVP